MTDQNKYNAYQNAGNTVNEIQQVIMLYEGSIKFIMQAKEAIKEKNHQDVHNLIHKAVNIINGLNSCLEFNDATNDTAKALDTFYQDIDLRLLHVICDHNIESCDKIISDLRTMMNAWKDIEQQTNQPKTNNNENSDNIQTEETDQTISSQENTAINQKSQEQQAQEILEHLQNNNVSC